MIDIILNKMENTCDIELKVNIDLSAINELMAAFRKISSLKIEVDISKLNQLVNIFALMEKSLKAASTTLNKINKSFAEVKEQLKISNQLQQNAEIISRTSQVVSILAAAFAIAAVAAKVFTSALAATGIGVFVILIGALIGAFISSSSATNDQTTAMDELTESIKEQSEAWEDMKETRKEDSDAVISQTSYIQELWQELKDYSEHLDNNNTSAERAAWIAQELSDLLGIEIDVLNAGTEAYYKQNEAIEKNIRQKKANALLEAMEPSYQEAINKVTGEYIKMLEYENRVKQIQAEIDSGEYSGITLQNKRKELEYYQGLFEEERKLYEEHSNTIQNYQDMTAATLQGDYDLVDDIAFRMNSTLKTSNNATRDELLAQNKWITSAYADMLSGATDATDEQQALTKRMLEQSVQELLKYMLNNKEITEEEYKALCGNMQSLLYDNNGALVSIITDGGILTQEAFGIAGIRSYEGYKDGIYEQSLLSHPAIQTALQWSVEDFEDNFLLVDSPSKRFIENGKYIVEGLKEGIISASDSSKSAFDVWGSKISGWFSGLKLPGIGVDVSYAAAPTSIMSSVMKFLNLPGFPSIKFSKYAFGGLVDPGQLFLAREAGPELVGRIGAHTAVMNNDQIVDSVRRGVFEAVSAAMAAGGNDYTFHITNELDGDRIGRQVVKYHNGIVKQTGSSPLLV